MAIVRHFDLAIRVPNFLQPGEKAFDEFSFSLWQIVPLRSSKEPSTYIRSTASAYLKQSRPEFTIFHFLQARSKCEATTRCPDGKRIFMSEVRETRQDARISGSLIKQPGDTASFPVETRCSLRERERGEISGEELRPSDCFAIQRRFERSDFHTAASSNLTVKL